MVHVFNWVDQVRGTREEARDGHNHESALDHCDGGDPFGAARVEAATTASAEVLDTLTRPGSRAERQARLDRLFTEWFEYVPGCDAANAYCAHPVHAWITASGKSDAHLTGRAARGCSTGGSSSDAVFMAALLFAAFRRGLHGRIG